MNMKKTLCATLALITAVLAGAQTANSLRYGHYLIESTAAPGRTALLAVELERRFEEYNRIFDFDVSAFPSPLRVRFFASRDDYSDYVSARLRKPNPAAAAVYLHYEARENRELVVLDTEEKAMLSYQSFVQFLRAFVPRPPSWVREGFAAYFDGYHFDSESQTLEYEEDIERLATVKAIDFPRTKDILLADVDGTFPPSTSGFGAAAWALVSFFFSGSGDAYLETLAGMIVELKPDFSAAINSEATYNYFALADGAENFDAALEAYIAGRKTFDEWIDEGQRAYAARDYTAAETAFRAAAEQKPGRWDPYYYLGLTAYDQKEWAAAELWYAAAFERNAGRGLIQYARGINAAASGSADQAVIFLNDAAASSPEYKTRAEDLIGRLR
jgi:hypothetical protein